MREFLNIEGFVDLIENDSDNLDLNDFNDIDDTDDLDEARDPTGRPSKRQMRAAFAMGLLYKDKNGKIKSKAKGAADFHIRLSRGLEKFGGKRKINVSKERRK